MTTPGAPRGIAFGRNLILPEIAFAPSIGFVVRRLNELNIDISSFREPLKRSVQQVMIPSIRANFDQEGRPESWEPLSEFSLEMRAKGMVRFNQGGATGSKILDATGNLKRKVTQLNLWTIDATKAEVKDIPQSVWYGKIHQEGYPIGTGYTGRLAQRLIERGATARQVGSKLHELGTVKQGRTAPQVPARPFLIMHPEDEDKVRDVFTVWLAERSAIFIRW